MHGGWRDGEGTEGYRGDGEVQGRMQGRAEGCRGMEG